MLEERLTALNLSLPVPTLEKKYGSGHLSGMSPSDLEDLGKQVLL